MLSIMPKIHDTYRHVRELIYSILLEITVFVFCIFLVHSIMRYVNIYDVDYILVVAVAGEEEEEEPAAVVGVGEYCCGIKKKPIS